MKTTINPFTREVIIEEGGNSVSFHYKEVDEWTAFELNKKIYDFHILYDEKLDISIYPVIDNKPNYTESIGNSVTVVY